MKYVRSSLWILSAAFWLAPISTQAVLFNPIEYAVNVDGTFQTSFDSTDFSGLGVTDGRDPVTNLGSFTVNLSGTGAHYVGLFVDYEIYRDDGSGSFFDEFGLVGGSSAAGQSWEIDEPGYIFGDIYDNFGAGTLDNSNAIDSALPDDVSMALAWDFALSAGESAVLSFFLGDALPAGFGGLYLEQVDEDTDASLYFWSSMTVQGESGGGDTGGGTPVPDGGVGAAGLLLGLAGVAAIRRGRFRS